MQYVQPQIQRGLLQVRWLHALKRVLLPLVVIQVNEAMNGMKKVNAEYSKDCKNTKGSPGLSGSSSTKSN